MPCPGELRIRILQPGEDHHLPLVAQGLGMTLEALEPAMSANNRAASGWAGYAGEVDGELAVTGTAIASSDGAGLISIVADPRFGRRGFGGALTSVAVADAFAREIPRVFLHASAQGLSLYERLGFEALESLLVFGRGED
jgi:ribosomal protein S18 acetylase RimI-like enzyme